MPKRPETDNFEWELHKDTILDLYVDQDKSLPEVIQALASQGFNRTKPQYERTLKKWHIAKNIRKDEWEFILSRLADRRSRPANVKVRGILVPSSRIERQKLKTRQTTFARCKLQFKPPPRPRTPPGIEIFTPPSSPDACHAHIGEDLTPNETLEEIHTDPRDHEGEWPQSLATLTDHSAASAETSLAATIPGHISTNGLPDDIELPFWLQTLPSDPVDSEQLYNLISATFNGNNAGDAMVLSGSKRQQVESGRTAPDPLLRHVITNHTTPEGILNNLMRRPLNSDQLIRLQDSFGPLISDVRMKSFGEKLLIDATIDGNLPLMEFLVEAGVDINARSHLSRFTESNGRKVNALQIAVYNRREDLIRYLLCHGADDWTAEYLGANGYIHGSILDVVVEMGMLHEWLVDRPEDNIIASRNILEVLLTFKSRARDQNLKTLVRATRLAVLQDREDLVALLLHHFPMLLEGIRSQPWLLLEPASTVQGTSMFDYLTSMGLNIKTTDPRGYGSVMASAAKHNNVELIMQLLDAHADINGIAYGIGCQDELGDSVALSEKKLQGIHGMAALHIAVEKNDEELTRLLLYYAANANQCCRVYPIQLATWNGHEGIVRLLIDHYADVNAAPPEDSYYSFTSGYLHNLPLRADQSSLHIALEKGHSTIVEILGNNGGVLEYFYSKGDLPVLYDAAAQGNATLVQRLLVETSRKVAPKLPNWSRALILAVRNKRDDVIDVLLNAGVSPYERITPGHEGTQDIDDRYRLHTCESSFEVALELQITKQVSKFLKFPPATLNAEQQLSRRRQLSAAYASALCSENTTLQEAILETGFNLDEVDQVMGPNYIQQRLHFALQHAAMSKRYDKVQRLLDAGASPNSPNKSTADTGRVRTPLQYAAVHNNIQVVKNLLAAGANVNAPAVPIEGTTALQAATINGNNEMLNLLIDAGANVNAPPGSFNGRSAIEGAAEVGNTDVVFRLLRAGADIKGRDNRNYRRTIHRAWNNGHVNLCHLIQRWKMMSREADNWAPIAQIVESMTSEELDFADEAARVDYESRMREYDSIDEDMDDSEVED